MSFSDGDSRETGLLLDQVREGDRKSLERLFDRHLPAIRKSIKRRLSSQLQPRMDLSDVVQETQQIALVRIDDFLDRRPMSFRLWLLRTAHQRLMDLERHHLASAKRAVKREVPLPDASSVQLALRISGKHLSPVSEAVSHELALKVRQSLACMSEKDREILFLRTFEGLSNSETASLLDMNPETTKKRFTRALIKLQTLLGEHGITESEL